MKNLLSISIFLLISLAWSFVFFVERPLDFILGQGYGHWELLIAFLPPLGMFLISLLLRKTDRPINPTTFFGHSRNWSLLIAALPIGLLAAFGVENDYGIQSNLFGLFIGAWLFIYTLLEEYGWRGYLQDALPIKQEWVKFGLIGLIWYVWHWDFVGSAISWNALLVMALLAFGALGIGRLADAKKSLLLCASFHAMGNIAMFSTFLRDHMPLGQRLTLVGICIIAWVVIFKVWDRQSPSESVEIATT